MTIAFTKMNGLGNDFVVLETITKPVAISAELIRQMADRNYGVGFDQLLLIEPGKQPGIDFEYRIFNADGSEVGQCGNGARCAGLFLWENNFTNKGSIRLNTKERVLEIKKGQNSQIMVNIGRPLFAPDAIPFVADQQQDYYRVDLDGKTLQFSVVNVGNPHAVIQVNDVQTAEVNTIGPLIESHEFFPQKVNVGFMQVLNRNQIRLRVFERGVGETLACGSGACAAMVIGRRLNLLDAKVTVELLGGQLTIEWDGDGKDIWMSGPCETVFKGQWLKS